MRDPHRLKRCKPSVLLNVILDVRNQTSLWKGNSSELPELPWVSFWIILKKRRLSYKKTGLRPRKEKQVREYQLKLII